MGRAPRVSIAVWLLLSHLGVGVVAVFVLLLSGTLDQDLRNQNGTSLRAQADLLALDLQDEVAGEGRGLAEAAARAAPRLTEAKARTLSGIQIVDAEATVLASAGATRDASLRDDPEVRAALQGRVGHAERPRDRAWPPSRGDVVGPSRYGNVRSFVAVPIVVRGEVLGAVVVSRTPRASLQTLVQMGLPLAWRVAVLLGFAILVALVAGHCGSRSLRQLVRAAHAIATGARRPSVLDVAVRSRVDEVHRVATAVDTMGSRLRARMDGAEAFAGNAAHELRTPISTVGGTLELLRDDPCMPTAQRERFLNTGIAELSRLDALIEGLLQLGRARRLGMDAEVELGVLIRDACESRGIDIEGDTGAVPGNPAALRTIITNLLDNAQRHGGANIRVRAWRREARVGFSVEDDGEEIPEAIRERIFQRFFTTDRENGTGLGLAVVRELVDVHGGMLSVRTEPGCTAFAVSLPLGPRARGGPSIGPGAPYCGT